MRRSITSTLLILGIMTGVQTASAASLRLSKEPPTIESGTGVIDYIAGQSGLSADLSTFADVSSTDGVALSGFATIDFAVSFSVTDPSVDLAGGFSVFDNNGLALGGDIAAIGFEIDKVEVLFDSLLGSTAGLFGNQALMTLSFVDPLGDNPFAAFRDGDIYDAEISISKVSAPEVIPLPAGIVLLLTALGGLGVVRRKSSLKTD